MVASVVVPELDSIPVPATTRQAVRAMLANGYEVVAQPSGKPVWSCEYIDYLTYMRSRPESTRYRLTLNEGRYRWTFAGLVDGQLCLVARDAGGKQVGGEWRFMTRSAALLAFGTISPFFVQGDEIEIVEGCVARPASRLVAVS